MAKTRSKAFSRGKGEGKKRYLRGGAASKPGEYPRKLTGHLRRNVLSEFDAATATARVGTNVIYGKYLETGTRKMAPRPWLSNAIRDFLPGIKAILEGGMPI